MEAVIIKNYEEKITKKNQFHQFTSSPIHQFKISLFHYFAISLFRYFTISLFLFSSLSIFSQNNQATLQAAFSKSYQYEYRGNFTDAISALKTVYQEDSYEINLRLGWVTYLAGLFTESSAYYQKAIALKPYSIEAKLGLANPASALGNWDQVITQYNDILAIDPQNSLTNYRMGSIYYGRKDYTKAEKYLEKVVNLYPFDYDSNILFAWTNLKLGKLREAQVLFNKVLLIKPTDASALEGLGLIK
jgi:tetratricopeptide (TPR) repeat protein